MVGPDQGERAEVSRLIATSDFADRFRILGDVPHEELMALLAKSSALVLPSVDEPYPMIVIEALAVGIPAIVTTSTGLREQLDRANAALLAEPRPECIADQMIAVAGSPELRAGLSSRGRELYSATWQPDGLGVKLEEYYLEALARSGSRL
jgi:glycosyltransferase involved in cell wall biosynthesis